MGKWGHMDVGDDCQSGNGQMSGEVSPSSFAFSQEMWEVARDANTEPQAWLRGLGKGLRGKHGPVCLVTMNAQFSKSPHTAKWKFIYIIC
jgi:hypothetical protein